ncbi:glycoside hydrolase family 78 protein [Maribellus sediminis]|uniref:glycoside hydrolase family 78 protein n=1 Tax=Maribellus sediminis TaxID=2696285 RepID=UPI00142FD382|nr:glycoside hydrolase family 78 protein [Maribellus sediminis]
MNQLNKFLTGISVFLSIAFFSFSGKCETNPVKLICEYHENPIGIDVVQPRLSWQLQSTENDVLQTAYQIRVAGSEKALNGKKLIWDSGKIESDQSVNVVYNGPAIKSMERVWWQVRVWDNKNELSKWSEPAYWEMGILEPAQWTASWITLRDPEKSKTSLPVHYLRNEFKLGKTVESARLYVSAQGLYEMFINGKKVGDQLFTPGWTSYENRIQYQTYDVTDLLKADNAIAAKLGDGWFRGFIGFSGQRNYYGDELALIAQLQITYKDGGSETINSDGSWKVNNGPIVESDIYNGELYDANLEIPGWNKPGFSDGNWSSATSVDVSKDLLVAPQGSPVKAVEELKPIAQMTTPKGEMVYDMGQNMVGWLRIKLKGEKGDTVRIKFAEVLDKEGNIYTANLRSAKATDTYIFGESGEITYEPSFTFHGFRFVQLIGVKAAPALEDLTGVVIYSDMPSTGSFECSDPLINQLQHNIRWGQKGNFLDVPTDCPQRDERLGWTGDAQAFSMTAGFNFNVAPFYTKWEKDVALDQQENGRVPHVVPDVLNGNGGATGWADVVAIIPWTVYKIYGDQRILEESYPAITKWIGYMNGRAGDDHLWTGDSHFGDWLAFATTRSDYPGATTEKDLIATAYFYYTTSLTAKIAGILGKNSDQQYYEQLAANIKKAFVAEFVTPNGRLVSHTQTAYVLALSFGLIPDDRIEKAAEYLAKDVEKFGHLTTGFLGTPLLCHTLSSIGRDDLAFMLLNRKQYPSWLYPVTQGATTIWERWDGQKPDGSFQDVGMNSFNHYAYGAIGEWLYSRVAGIKIDEAHPGYKHFILAPHPGGGLTYVKATFESVYGQIVSDWKIENGEMVYNVEIPANTTASVVLPNAGGAALQTNTKAEQQRVGDDLEMLLGSGKYSFSYPIEIKK